MLTELAITDLGVISELSLVLGPGLTAVTGETGAGKTMVVEAIGRSGQPIRFTVMCKNLAPLQPGLFD